MIEDDDWNEDDVPVLPRRGRKFDRKWSWKRESRLRKAVLQIMDSRKGKRLIGVLAACKLLVQTPEWVGEYPKNLANRFYRMDKRLNDAIMEFQHA